MYHFQLWFVETLLLFTAIILITIHLQFYRIILLHLPKKKRRFERGYSNCLKKGRIEMIPFLKSFRFDIYNWNIIFDAYHCLMPSKVPSSHTFESLTFIFLRNQSFKMFFAHPCLHKQSHNQIDPLLLLRIILTFQAWFFYQIADGYHNVDIFELFIDLS